MDTDEVWPRPRTTFVGREREIAETTSLLADGARWLTLVGPGGVGKTRLALEIVDRLDVATTGEPGFVALAAVRNPALVLPAIADAIRAPVDGRGPLTAIVERIGKKRRLLLLDNMERLVETRGDLSRVLEACPAARLLVTSRTPLGTDDEHVLDIEPLSLPDGLDAADAEGVRSNPAVRLFLDSARAAQADFEATDEDARRIVEICRRLDGIPLAIELAAARVTVLPPAAMLGRLERRMPLLASRRTDLPERLRTMRNAIGWSYDLLDEGEQTIFRRLSAFDGGFSLHAAERIAAGWAPTDGYPFAGGQRVYEQSWQADVGKEPPRAEDGEWDPPALPGLRLDVVNGLEALLNHRLIRPVDPIDDDAQFEMLETIREFGREELERMGETPAVDHAHAALALGQTEAAGWGMWGRDRRRWLARMEADLGNYRAAMTWLAGQAAPANQLLLRLADAPWYFWLTRGRIAEGRRYLDTALAQPGGTETARASALNTVGYLALLQREPHRAREALEESLLQCRATDYRLGEARCRLFLALAAWDRNDYLAMEDHAQAAFSLYEAGHDRLGMGASLIALSIITRVQGRFADAETVLAEAVKQCSEAGFEWGVATCAYFRATGKWRHLSRRVVGRWSHR